MEDLKKKIAETLAGVNIASLATVDLHGNPWVRYVICTGDKDFYLTFATFASSRKIKHIEKNPNVHLTLRKDNENPESPYIQFAGKAEVIDDKEKLKAYWNPNLEHYFSGPEDPEYRLVKVTPKIIEYMSTSHTPEVLAF